MLYMARRWLQLVEHIATLFAGMAIISMMAVIAGSALSRYMLGDPITGVYEVVIYYLMPAVVWFGMAGTERRQAHVRITFIVEKLRGVRRIAVTTTTRLIAAGLVLLIAISSISGVETAWGKSLAGAVSLPVGPSRLLVTIGAGLLFLRLVVGSFEKEPEGEHPSSIDIASV